MGSPYRHLLTESLPCRGQSKRQIFGSNNQGNQTGYLLPHIRSQIKPIIKTDKPLAWGCWTATQSFLFGYGKSQEDDEWKQETISLPFTCSCSAQFASSSRERNMGWGLGGTLSTIYNGRFEKTVTFSFWMAFKAQTWIPYSIKTPTKIRHSLNHAMRDADSLSGNRLQKWIWGRA